MKNNGFFITIEKTCDGLGGSTQVKRLYEKLLLDGFDVIQTCEPSPTKFGKIARYMLLNPSDFFGGDYELSPATELLLFNADRAQHHHEVIKPSLENGKTVICDRYIESTRGYQCGGRGWDEKTVWELHDISSEGLVPHLTIILDGTPFKEMDGNDTFEKSGEDFYEKVRTKLLDVAKESNRFVVIDANQDLDVVENQICSVVIKRMQEVGYGKTS